MNSHFRKSIGKTRYFLETAVNHDNVTDIYDLAIVSYALSRTGSAKAYVTYKRLEKLATRTRGIYTFKLLKICYSFFNKSLTERGV
jgi:hypothetical protein